MYEHGLHAQFISDQARMLSAGAAKALQRELGGVVSLLHRDLLDRVRHVRHRDAQEALSDVAGVAALPGRLGDLLGHFPEACTHDISIQWLAAIRSKDRWEVAGWILPRTHWHL